MEINIKLDTNNKEDKKNWKLINELFNTGKLPEPPKETSTPVRPEPQVTERPDIPEMPEDLRLMPQSDMGRSFGRSDYMNDYDYYRKMAQDKIDNPPKKKGFFSRVRFE